MVRYFTYNGKSSEDFDLEIAYMDTEPNKELGGNFEYVTYRNNKSPINVIQNIDYNVQFEYDVEFFSAGHTILDSELGDIYNWLFNQSEYCKFTYESWEGTYLNCVFTNPEKIYVGGDYGYGVYGIKATLKADSNFLWKDEDITFTENNFTLNNRTFLREYTYPTVTIKTNGGSVTLQNITDNNRLTSFVDTLSGDTLTISSYPRSVKSYLNKNDLLTYESFNKIFPRLVQGENKYGFVGDITEVNFKYKSAQTYATIIEDEYCAKRASECVTEFGFATREEIHTMFERR